MVVSTTLLENAVAHWSRLIPSIICRIVPNSLCTIISFRIDTSNLKRRCLSGHAVSACQIVADIYAAYWSFSLHVQTAVSESHKRPDAQCRPRPPPRARTTFSHLESYCRSLVSVFSRIFIALSKTHT